MTEFLDEIRSPSTKKKYQPRLAQFLDFANAKGDTFAQKARGFTTSAKKDHGRTTLAIN